MARICGWRFFLDTKPAIYVLRRSEKIGYPPWHIQIRLAMLFPQTFCAFHLDAPSQLLLWGNNMVIQLRDITQAYIYIYMLYISYVFLQSFASWSQNMWYSIICHPQAVHVRPGKVIRHLWLDWGHAHQQTALCHARHRRGVLFSYFFMGSPSYELLIPSGNLT